MAIDSHVAAYQWRWKGGDWQLGVAPPYIKPGSVETRALVAIDDFLLMERLRLENEQLKRILKKYEDLFCEGFCEDIPVHAPPCYGNSDCSGCLAREALRGNYEL